MEKNKIRFIIWLLIVIIIILATAVGTLLYKIVSENGTKIMEDNNIKDQVQVDENSNNEIIDDIESNDAINNENQENDVIGQTKELTEEKVIELAKRLLENGRGTPDEVVRALYGQYIETTDEEFTQNYASYKMTNVDYNEFKSEALKYYTEEYFNHINQFKNMIIALEKDGKVAVLQGGWSGTNYQVKRVAFDKKEEDIYYYTVETLSDNNNDFVKFNMTVKLVNDNFVIDSLT